MNELETDPSAQYRRVNVEGTRELARTAVEAGARQLIYMSSIKVNGESTRGNRSGSRTNPGGGRVRHILHHPGAANQVFLLSDGEDASTPDLAGPLAQTLQVRLCLLSAPSSLLHLLGRLAGTAAAIERLAGSLQVDSSHIRAALGWLPPFSRGPGPGGNGALVLRPDRQGVQEARGDHVVTTVE